VPHHPFPVVLDAWAGSLSPDNRQIVFTRTSRQAIEILDLDSLKRWVVIPAGKDVVWSPTGKHLVYVTEPSTDAYQAEEVWVADCDGQNARKLATGGYPRWSADGKRVFLHDRQKQRIVSVTVDGGEVEVFFEPTAAFYPAISPDETRIAMGEGGVLQIVERATGKVVRELKTPGDRGLLPSWSPDGRWVTFGGFDDSTEGLRVLDVETGKLAVLIKGPVTLPLWSPDGTRMTVDYRGRDGRILMLVGRAYVEARLEDSVPVWEP
jgi:Tol biopolymer transport system component